MPRFNYKIQTVGRGHDNVVQVFLDITFIANSMEDAERICKGIWDLYPTPREAEFPAYEAIGPRQVE
jgi:hypothetical protein